MSVLVREMTLEESDIVIDYFLSATPEFLETMGVDPTRRPARARWGAWLKHEFGLPVRERDTFFLIWTEAERAIGFSSCDKIVFGDHTFMHLHVTEPQCRRGGLGAACIRLGLPIYFEKLALRRLYCEPNAYNAAPNRALQAAGFRYVKTHRTVPGRLNYHQAVTRWLFEPEAT